MIFSGKRSEPKLRQCKISHFPRENKKAVSIGRVGRASEDQKGRSTPVGAPAGSAGEADFLGGSQVSHALPDSSDRSDSSDKAAPMGKNLIPILGATNIGISDL